MTHIVWPDSSIHIICHNICPLKLLPHSKRSATLEGSTVVWGINHLNTKLLARAVWVSHIWNHRLIPTLAYKSSEHDTDSSHAIRLPAKYHSYLLNLTSNPFLGFYCKVIGVSYQSTYDTIQSFSCWNLQPELDMQDTCSRHVLTLKQKDIPPEILSSHLGVVMMTNAATTQMILYLLVQSCSSHNDVRHNGILQVSISNIVNTISLLNR